MRPCLWWVLGPRIAPRVPLARPSLLIANHLTAFDVPVVLYALTSNDRDHVAGAMSGELLSRGRRGMGEGDTPGVVFLARGVWVGGALCLSFPLLVGGVLGRDFCLA